MTSPLRRAREEVAVNIAVTGFVSRLFPTQTRDLARAMEELQDKVRTARGQIRVNEREMANLARTVGTTHPEYLRLQKENEELNKQAKSWNQTIRENRQELRQLQSQNTENLNRIRGFGIALGVTALSLGAMGAATIAVAGNMREMEIQAYRTDTSVQSLQENYRSFLATLGSEDAAKQATDQLADLRNQIALFQQSGSLFSNINIRDFALAGLDINQLYGRTEQQIRDYLSRQIQLNRNNPFRREALQRAIPSGLYDALVYQRDTPAASFEAFSITPEQQTSLRQINRDFGEIRVSLGAIAQVLTVAVAPAMIQVFGMFNVVAGPIVNFIADNQAAALVVGTFAAATLGLIGAISTVAIVVYTARLAHTAFFATITVGTGTINAYRIALFLVTAAKAGFRAGTISSTAALATQNAFMYSGRLAVLAYSAGVWIGAAANSGFVVSVKLAIVSSTAWTTVMAAGRTFMLGWTLATTLGTAAIVGHHWAVQGAVLRMAAYNIALKAGAIAYGAVTTATWVATAAQWAWNIALTANPIGIVVVAVAALTGAIAALLIYKDEVDDFMRILGNDGREIKSPFSAIKDDLESIKGVIDAVTGSTAWHWINRGLGLQGGPAPTPATTPTAAGASPGGTSVVAQNTFYIQGTANAEETAILVTEKQGEAFRTKVDSRPPNLVPLG